MQESIMYVKHIMEDRSVLYYKRRQEIMWHFRKIRWLIIFLSML